MTLTLTLILILILTLTLSLILTLTLTFTLTLTPIAMALVEEQEWAIKIRKYGGGINLGETIKDELAEFIKIKIYIYKKKDFLNNTL